MSEEKSSLSNSSITHNSELLTSRGNWQRDMQSAFRTLPPLLEYLNLDPKSAPALLSDPAFPILAPRGFADRMVKGDWNDPLLLQVIPRAEENKAVPGFSDDAVGDLAAQAAPGLLHKYASRALMMLTPNCAVHCRYCFRREFPYGGLPRARESWDEAWAYLSAHEEIDELILSGGDPLFLDNRRLAVVFEKALALSHLSTLRIHTRLPIVLPSRVEAGLMSLLSDFAAAKTVVVVVHANHPNEIAGDCAEALARLRSTGALLLNQSVLLRGVNDDSGALAELSRRLVKCGVMPYYLHQLDRVAGAAHFEVAEAHGHALMDALRTKLPGYLVPLYVREVAGEPHKIPLTPPRV
jgi:EF-P beta-lysylation protein EpmB